MDCCSTLNEVFDRKSAENGLRNYYKNGLARESKILFNFLKGRIRGLSVLEIGCGIGSLNMELVKAGASRSLGVDASEASIEVARILREKLGLKNVELKALDFVNAKAPRLDAVVSDKVICCYPDMEKLIKASALRAREYYGIIYPREHVLMHMFATFGNWFNWFSRKRKGFRFYIHSNRKIRKRIESHGLERVFDKQTLIWNIEVYRRR